MSTLANVLALSATLLATTFAGTVHAEALLQLEGKVFDDNNSQLEAAPVTLRLNPASIPVRAGRNSVNANVVVLPPLSDSERQRLQQSASGNEKALRVGVGRVANTSKPDTWNWMAVEGGQATHVSLTSTGAKRLRVQVQLALTTLPKGVELRFYSPAEPTTVYGPYTQTELLKQPKDAQGNTLFWSPSVMGETLKMEVFLPTEVQPTAVNLTINQLSHIVVDPATRQAEPNTLKASTVSCHLDVACTTPALQQEGVAVSGYWITDAKGNSGFCSGTLVNNSANNGIPYFLTANHCINNATDAASMNFIWLFANTSCGSNDALKRAVYTSGGGQLLVTEKAVDTTLIHLNERPPFGTYFAGWSAKPLKYNESVETIGHVAITDGVNIFTLPKNYSRGSVLGGDVTGKFAMVQWLYGVTAKGESGSGLWAIEQGNQYYLKGTLWGGSSSCTNPTGIDYYARFDQAYPLLKPWLNPTEKTSKP
jgi:hypothetical protein